MATAPVPDVSATVPAPSARPSDVAIEVARLGVKIDSLQHVQTLNATWTTAVLALLSAAGIAILIWAESSTSSSLDRLGARLDGLGGRLDQLSAQRADEARDAHRRMDRLFDAYLSRLPPAAPVPPTPDQRGQAPSPAPVQLGASPAPAVDLEPTVPVSMILNNLVPRIERGDRPKLLLVDGAPGAASAVMSLGMREVFGALLDGENRVRGIVIQDETVGGSPVRFAIGTNFMQAGRLRGTPESLAVALGSAASAQNSGGSIVGAMAVSGSPRLSAGDVGRALSLPADSTMRLVLPRTVPIGQR